MFLDISFRLKSLCSVVDSSIISTGGDDMDSILYVLLVEDDIQACNEIENYIYSLEDIELVGITNNASRALQRYNSRCDYP